MPLMTTALRYFDEVARQGSIRRAADQLHVAASAVNRQILKLEDELGVPLFERLPRKLDAHASKGRTRILDSSSSQAVKLSHSATLTL